MAIPAWNGSISPDSAVTFSVATANMRCEYLAMLQSQPKSDSRKFDDPNWTATGGARAWVAPAGLETLWFNTGTLCNIACHGCYIESTPRNDRLAYISRGEVAKFIAEAARDHPGLREIGFTGGEPFMNPDIIAMLTDSLAGGYRTLVLTNAMKPMRRHQPALLELKSKYSDRLSVRVSLDHFIEAKHEAIRGRRSWRPGFAARGFGDPQLHLQYTD